MKKKRFFLIILAVMLCIGNIGINMVGVGAIFINMLNKKGEKALMEEREILGLDFSNAEKFMDVNDISGLFPMDGMTFEAWRFDKNYIASRQEKIFKAAGWKSCPLSDIMSRELYGYTGENNSYFASVFVNPYDVEKPLFPEIRKGYYFFYNQEEGTNDPYNEIYLERMGKCDKYVVALYDLENNILYYGTWLL